MELYRTGDLKDGRALQDGIYRGRCSFTGLDIYSTAELCWTVEDVGALQDGRYRGHWSSIGQEI